MMVKHAGIEPLYLRDYLRANGWTMRPEGLRHRLFIMRSPGSESREIYFPMEREADDYDSSMLMAIEKLAETAEKTMENVLSAVKSVYDDVLNFRVFSEIDRPTLSLDFANQFISSSEKLIRSATCSVVRPRQYHPRLALTEANSVVEATQFGQTGEGSFIFRILCPINSMETPATHDLFGDEPTPFVRRVTMNVQEALLKLTDAIESDSLDELVADEKASQTPLISSNLCEAVFGMQDAATQNSLDVTVNWSPTSNLPAPQRSGRIRIHKSYFSRIEEVARELKSVSAPTEAHFIGTVERLDGTMDADGRRSGNVVILLFLADGETVKASAHLTAEQYEQADRAHMTPGAFVAIAGVLHAGRQPRTLSTISHFGLVGDIFG